jgi:hypothetical protein
LSKITRLFEEPIIIILSWMILIVGVLGAAKLVGAKLPTEGPAAGVGDLFRTA